MLVETDPQCEALAMLRKAETCLGLAKQFLGTSGNLKESQEYIRDARKKLKLALEELDRL
jgi:hypothetical protein